MIKKYILLNYIKKCKGLSYEERLRKLGIPTLEYRRHRADLIQVYRLFSGIDRMDANVFFSLHNEDEAGSVRAETRGHPRTRRIVKMLHPSNYQSVDMLEG